jgi:hypothetical protein
MSLRTLKPFLRYFVPKDQTERLARENARMLMQAQGDLGVLMQQMEVGTQDTTTKIEWIEDQQAGQEQPHSPEQREPSKPRNGTPEKRQEGHPPPHYYYAHQGDQNHRAQPNPQYYRPHDYYAQQYYPQ